MTSGNPTRLPNGVTQQQSYQPMGQIGVPDPFFYAYYEDDFVPYNSAIYTATLDGGTAAQTVANGGGGRVKLTTAGAASDFVGLQLLAAPFLYTAGLKMFYGARLQVSTIANTSFIAGLCQTTATPATITDGIYFKFTAGGTYIQLIAVTGSTVIGTLNLPTTTVPVNATDFDVGFYVDRRGNILAFAGQGLWGNKTQQYAYSTIQPIGRLWGASQSVAVGTPILTGAITTAYLNPTLAVFTTNTTVGVLIADFQAAGTER
jgi:hypothetical protein